MIGDELPQINTHKPAVSNYWAAVDIALVDTGGSNEQHGGNRVVQRPGVLEAPEGDSNEVCGLPRFERSDVISTEHGGRAPGRHSKCLPCCQELTPFD